MQERYTVLARVHVVLEHVTAADLPDLLLITLSYSLIELAEDATSILLYYDRNSLHLLHTNKAAVQTQPAAVTNRSCLGAGQAEAGLGLDGIAYAQRAGGNAAVAQITAQLIGACASSVNLWIMQRLVDLPAAQKLGKVAGFVACTRR